MPTCLVRFRSNSYPSTSKRRKKEPRTLRVFHSVSRSLSFPKTCQLYCRKHVKFISAPTLAASQTSPPSPHPHPTTPPPKWLYFVEFVWSVLQSDGHIIIPWKWQVIDEYMASNSSSTLYYKMHKKLITRTHARTTQHHHHHHHHQEQQQQQHQNSNNIKTGWPEETKLSVPSLSTMLRM